MLSATLVAMESAVSAMREELVAICSRYSWLGGVWQFLQQWEGRGRATQLSAEEFEVCQQAVETEGGSGLGTHL